MVWSARRFNPQPRRCFMSSPTGVWDDFFAASDYYTGPPLTEAMVSAASFLRRPCPVRNPANGPGPSRRPARSCTASFTKTRFRRRPTPGARCPRLTRAAPTRRGYSPSVARLRGSPTSSFSWGVPPGSGLVSGSARSVTCGSAPLRFFPEGFAGEWRGLIVYA